MGWIKLDRKIQYNKLWTEKPFSRGQAWVDLLLLANHADRKYIYHGKSVVGKRGDVNVSQAWLSDRWGWSRGKVRRFMDELETNAMITKNGTPYGTTVSIENYALYQDERPTSGQSVDQPWTNHGPHTRKKEYKNINNIYIPLVSEVERFVEENGYKVDAIDFYDYYSGQGWKKANGMPVKDWRACVRSWHRKAMKANETENASKDAREKRLAELAEQDRREIAEMNEKARAFRKEKRK